MEIREFINRQNWIFAKTYADKAPHEYALRSKCDNDEDFIEAVKYINENGFRARFWNSKYTYFFIDGYFYWTMDYPLENTKLINRCKSDWLEISVRPKQEKLSNGNNV